MVDGIGTLYLLNAMHELTKTSKPNCKFYQASTSELFGKVQEVPQKETTPFYPRSPYAVAKQYAYWMVVNYREAYNLFCVNGILFNHESPRRGNTFVTRKITRAIGKQESFLKENKAAASESFPILYLGNLDAKRDWGHAKDYIEGMWLMLQGDTPRDYVLATGETHSVREFVEMAYQVVGITIKWVGSGVLEKGVDSKDENRVLVAIDPEYFRPTEVDLLIGDPTRARTELGWSHRVTFQELVKEMVLSDL